MGRSLYGARLAGAVLVGTLAFGGLASAQDATSVSASSFTPPVGKQAGTFMIRLRAIDVIPEDNGSSTSIGGHVKTTSQPAPEADFSYFFTDNIAAELITATTRHTMKATGTAVGSVDVGSTWVLPPTVTLQYHFMPHERFSPYVGAGVNLTMFYASHPSGPTVTSLKVDDSVGAALQVGFDYNVTGHWFANVDVKQIFVSTKAHLNTALGPVTAKTSLDPLVVGFGIGYRF